MACPRKNGIRYPLELDYLQPQASDTPRFPSRQAAFLHELHELKVKDTTGKVKREEKQVKDSLYFSFCRSEKGGDQEMKNEKYMGREDLIILNKLGNLGKVDEQSSVQQVQHKSIKSLSSLRERLANRSASKKIRQIRQIVKNRQKKTMSSLISIKFESPARKKQQEDKKQDKQTKPNSKHKSTLKKYYNNDKNIKIKALQDHQDQNRKLQLESKLNSDKKKLDKRNFFDKGRSLKSLLMRTKPNLQIKNRLLSNSKLQNFSQIVQSFLQNS